MNFTNISLRLDFTQLTTQLINLQIRIGNLVYEK
jgi:hypothetical protein